MVDKLTLAYQAHLRSTRAAVSDAVGAQWRALGSYNEADVGRFVSAVSPVVSAGQIRAVSLTQAYVARKTGSPIVGVDVPALQATLRNGVGSDVVYRRPFVRVWTTLKRIGAGDEEGDYETAVQVGQNQAESNSDMDIALAMMAAYVALGSSSSDSGSEDEIVAWRRVADGNCCDYCQMLDGVHTGPDEPQPLHNRCGCTAEPIMRRSRITGDLASPGDSIEGVTIHQHGELGPVISRKGDSFTSIDDLTAQQVAISQGE